MGNHENRTVICYESIRKSGNTGQVQAVFEKIDNKLYKIDNAKNFFCESGGVFITKSYDEIENKYKGKLFSLVAKENPKPASVGECIYIMDQNHDTQPIKTSDIIEIIKAKLPDAKNRKINSFNYIPSTRYIFVDDGFLYGPFEYEVSNNLAEGFDLNLSTTLLAIKLINNSAPNGYICKIKITNDILTESIVNEDKRKFVLNIETLSNIQLDHLDYRSDDLIIQEGNKILKAVGREFSKNEIRDLKNDVLNIPNLNQFDEETINRFFPLFEKLEEWERISNDIIKKYFVSQQGSKCLADYIESNKERYFETVIN